MKDEIKKFSEGLAQVATLLKEEKVSEAVDALATVADEVATLSEKVDAAEAKAVEKAEKLASIEAESASKDEQIAKWASLNVSTDDLPKLFEELGAIKTAMSGVTDIAKSLAKSEDIESIGARLEAIEKTAVSRQISEENRESVKKAANFGINLDPRG